MSAIIAYHNDPAVAGLYRGRARAHRDADEIIQGFYWSNGKGCALGCLAETNDDPHEAL